MKPFDTEKLGIKLGKRKEISGKYIVGKIEFEKTPEESFQLPNPDCFCMPDLST